MRRIQQVCDRLIIAYSFSVFDEEESSEEGSGEEQTHETASSTAYFAKVKDDNQIEFGYATPAELSDFELKRDTPAYVFLRSRSCCICS